MDKLARRLRLYVLGFISLISVGAKAVELPPVAVQDFTPGLVTKQDASDICDGCSQDLMNVDVYTGAIEKRRGSVKQNSSVIGGFTTQPVRFLHEYVDTANNDYLLFITSNSLYRSADGGASSTLVTSTFGITNLSRFCGVNAYGNAYLTDGTTNWMLITGTSISPLTAAPKGPTCEFFGERLITSVGSTFYASRFGDATDWTADAGTDNDAFSQNIRQSNGYNIRAIKRFRFGLLVFKDYSTDLYTISPDGLTFVLTPVSNTIGTQYPESVVERENDAIWLAHDGFYSYNGSTLKKISEVIKPTFEQIQQLNSSQRSIVQTTQSDFSLGTLSAGMSISNSPGDIVFESTSTLDQFTDGDFTASPVWTAVGSGVTTIASNGIAQFTPYTLSMNRGVSPLAQNGGVYTPLSFSAHSLTFDFSFAGSSPPTVGENAFVKFTTGTPTGAETEAQNGYTLTLVPGSSNNLKIYRGTTLLVTGSVSISRSVWYTATFSRDSSSVWRAYVNGVLISSTTDSTYTSFANLTLGYSATNNNGLCTYDNLYTVPLGGTYQSPVHTIGSSISTWNPIAITGSNSSGASQTYAVYTDTDSSIDINNASTFTSSQTVTNGSAITIAVGSRLTFVVTFTRSAPSETSTFSDYTISWNEGSSVFPVSSLYYQGSYIAAVAMANTTRNDRMLVYDQNGAWTIYSYPAYYLARYRQRPYFGSAIQGDIARFQADGIYQDFDGSAIDSYWISKEFDFGNPLTAKTINRYYVTAKYRADDEATFEWGVNRGSLTSESPMGTLDLDSNAGFFRKSIVPSSLTYKKGLSHRFKISNSTLGDRFDILSVTLKTDLETSP